MKLKVACGYQMGVGKDEACGHLQRKHGGVIVSLSKPLYDIMNYAQQRCGLPHVKDRKLLQLIGTDWLGSYKPNILAQLALNDISTNYKESNVYISDLRLMDQFNMLRENGFIMVKIVRPRDESMIHNRAGTGSSQHRSEVELDSIPNKKWDSIIYNNGNLKHLYS